jgi:hypothetical protein
VSIFSHNIPVPDLKELETYLIKNGWKKVPGGWNNPDTKEYGAAIYTGEHAYRITYEVLRAAKAADDFDRRHPR